MTFFASIGSRQSNRVLAAFGLGTGRLVLPRRGRGVARDA